MQLKKHINFDDVCIKTEGDAMRFTGYASKFGGVDTYGDTIVKGAFDATLKEHGNPLMYLEHSVGTMFAQGAAALPIGKYLSIKEDDVGLLVDGELTPGLSIAADVYAAMKHGTLSGLSVGGYVKKGDYQETETGRIIHKWSRLVEISAVAMPADSGARVQTVKGEDISVAIEDIATIREFERFLRDAAGLSKSASLQLVARVKTLFEHGDHAQKEEAMQMQMLLQKLQTLGNCGAVKN